MMLTYAQAKNTPMKMFPNFAHDTVETLLPRMYQMKLNTVVVIITLMPPFFADITPKLPSTGCCCPPMAFNSAGVITMVCGVIKTKNPQMSRNTRYLMYR